MKVDDILGKAPGQELPNGRKKTEEGGNIGTHESSSTTNSDGTRAKTITISRPKTGRVNSGTRKYREHDE